MLNRLGFQLTFSILSLACPIILVASEVPALLTHVQGEMAGELTHESVILQSRLTYGKYTYIDPEILTVAPDVPGRPGIACFEISTSPDFVNCFRTKWLDAVAERDFIVKTLVVGLAPGTKYYYRLIFGADRETTRFGPVRSFTTLAGKGKGGQASFAIITGMNFSPFRQLYKGADKHLGYPALEGILKLKPDFIVATGDNVYYDVPAMRDNTPLDLRRPAARTEEQLRKKWHEQFVQPRFVELFSQVPVYFQKDDHDFRYNDCDAFTEQAPSSELGARIFLEQVPLADPEGDPKTYRTHRINELLQIWLTEGRDYRTPSTMPDGPEKTLWGREQSVWLKKTLSESDAKFKLLISPTPLIGPDGANRRDNHSGLLGYSHERDEFLGWLLSYDSIREGFYIICGDRHWQYHSISPKGFDEFSCGALNDENALVGRRPGDPASNDPNGRITQPFHPQQKSGGFLYVEVVPAHDHLPDTLSFSWYDDNGTLLHRTSKLGEK